MQTGLLKSKPPARERKTTTVFASGIKLGKQTFHIN